MQYSADLTLLGTADIIVKATAGLVTFDSSTYTAQVTFLDPCTNPDKVSFTAVTPFT